MLNLSLFIETLLFPDPPSVWIEMLPFEEEL
jgi:hypothetical protein